MTAAPLNLIQLPLRAKVPLLVAGMMIVVSVVISHVVLSRLAENQETNFQRLTGAYLDGLSTALVPALVRNDVWEAYDAIDRSRSQYEGLKANSTILVTPDLRVLAASDPSTYPVDVDIPPAVLARFAPDIDLVIDESEGTAWVRRALVVDSVALGAIYAIIDVAPLIAERRHVLFALIAVNTLLTLLLASIGYYVVRRMVQPVSVLGDYVERLRSGRAEDIPASHIKRQAPEFAALFRRFNAMAAAISEREALRSRLAEEEKLAVVGKLASGMAHEVNNPLGGMLNAVDTLKKHGDDALVRESSIGLLERGLRGIGNVVRATLVSYKDASEPTHLTHDMIEDVRYLVQHETNRRQLDLRWKNSLPDHLNVDGSAVRQAILNLLLNACQVSPVGSWVSFTAELTGSIVVMTIQDQGPGLPDVMATLYGEPKADTPIPDDGTGLGGWIVTTLVAKLSGTIDVETDAAGTCLVLRIPLNGREALSRVA